MARDSQAALMNSCDLAPTTDLRAVMKGVLKDQFSAVKPLQGLVG